MYMIKIYVFFLRKKFIQFAFPGKGMKEIGRERKIVSNLFPIKSFEITSAKSQGSRKRKRPRGYSSPVYDRKRARVLFPRCFREIGLRRVPFYYPRRTEIIVSRNCAKISERGISFLLPSNYRKEKKEKSLAPVFSPTQIPISKADPRRKRRKRQIFFLRPDRIVFPSSLSSPSIDSRDH